MLVVAVCICMPLSKEVILVAYRELAANRSTLIFFEGFRDCKLQFHAVPVLQLLHMPRTVYTVWHRLHNATMLHKRTWCAEVEDFRKAASPESGFRSPTWLFI